MDNGTYGEEELPPTPRKTMIDLLSRWTGVPVARLDRHSTEGLRDCFKRASDPAMCAVAAVAGVAFAAGGIASYMSGHPVDTAFLIAGAILDGGGAIHHYSELKKVRAELQKAAAIAPQNGP